MQDAKRAFFVFLGVRKMSNNEEYFRTKSISTAAALLASDQNVKLQGIEEDTDGKSLILLTPYSLASDKHDRLIHGDLYISASENTFYIHKIKNLIFESREYKSISDN